MNRNLDLKNMGLIINNPMQIEKVNNMNFSKFVNYCDPFIINGNFSVIGEKSQIVRFDANTKFAPNVEINDILLFIEICEKIRRKTTVLLLEVERILKDKISVLFKQSRGKKQIDEFWHLRYDNFWRSSKGKRNSRNFLQEVSNLIQNHSTRYNLTGTETSDEIVNELLSFTELTQIYYYFSGYQVKAKISRYFGCDEPDYFSTGIFVLAKFVRNLDFHTKPSYRRIDNSQFPRYNVGIGVAKMLYPWVKTPLDFSNFYGRISFLVYITSKFSNDDFVNARKEIKQLMQKIPVSAVNYLGIPQDWLSEPLWKNI